ncbi:MAG: hypothetical protein EON58_08055 [Alphaproteobacteria bacterium]|nr:MAG: hypothetical protein EON58_08055 [Alphaproteobacteria bacterium]
MFSILAYPELILRALQDAAWTAEHGTREEKSGKFLPPPGWKGQCITGAPGEIEAYKARMAAENSDDAA